MKPETWLFASFGIILGLVVGMRLSMAGMLFVATALTSSVVLVPLFLWRERYAARFANTVEVFIERPPAKARALLPKEI